MTNLRKAAEMALEALNSFDLYDGNELWSSSADASEIDSAITALRQALAQPAQEPICAHGVCKTKCDFCKQPEQEPVGYVTDSGKSAYFLKGVDLDDDTPLYTAPPKRECNECELLRKEIKQAYIDGVNNGIRAVTGRNIT